MAQGGSFLERQMDQFFSGISNWRREFAELSLCAADCVQLYVEHLLRELAG
jgi:hypothetical protein